MKAIILIFRALIFAVLMPFICFSVMFFLDGLMLGNQIHGTKIENIASVFGGAALNTLLLFALNIVVFFFLWTISEVIVALSKDNHVFFDGISPCVVGVTYLYMGHKSTGTISVGVVVGALIACIIQYACERCDRYISGIRC